MKRLALSLLLPFFCVSLNGFAQVSETILVIHANGSSTEYMRTANTAASACGLAFDAASSALVVGDQMQIPAVTCTISPKPCGSDTPWPARISIAGQDPLLTVLNTSDSLCFESYNQVLQDLTVNVSCGDECSDGAITAGADGGSFTMRRVNLNDPSGGGGGTPAFETFVPGNVLLDRVKIASGDTAISIGDGTVTIRHSSAATTGNSALFLGGGIGNIFSSIISTAGDDSDPTVYMDGGLLNIFAGTSVIAHPGLAGFYCSYWNPVDLYPANYVYGLAESDTCTIDVLPSA